MFPVRTQRAQTAGKHKPAGSTPRVGGFVVMAWLFAIAAQLVLMGQYLDIAVRDCVMALGALTLARLTPFVETHEDSPHA